MTSIVLSFVGEQDPCSPKTNQEGSIVTLLRYLLSEEYKIAKIVLMYTLATEKGAEETREWLELHEELNLLSGKVVLIPVSEGLSEDPTDLLLAAQEARKGLERVQSILESGDRIEFNASSGTPAMKSSLSVLQAAGYAPDSQVWQVRNPDKIKDGQTRVFKTDVQVLRQEFDLKAMSSQIEGFNYGAATITLKNSTLMDSFRSVGGLLMAGKAWHRGEFDVFYGLAKSYLTDAQKSQGDSWWWMAYEQAYTAMVRLEQGNTSEAMQHSFRAVEGALWEWAIATFPNDVVDRENQYPLLKPTILKVFPALRSRYEEQSQRSIDVELKGWILRNLVETAIPATVVSDDFGEYWNTARKARNQISHRLGGISEKQVLAAWGEGICTRSDLEKRLLRCLNLLTRKSFRSLVDVSLFAKVHQRVLETIASYQP